jgi:hypothetical protein
MHITGRRKMSIAIGLTAGFAAVAGFTIAGAAKFSDSFSVWGSASNKLPSWSATLLMGTLIGGGLGGGSAWYFDEQASDLNNISLSQAEEIVTCHKKTPEGFTALSGLNKDGSVSCSYLKPN